MNPWKALFVVIALSAGSLACSATVGAGGMVSVPKDSAATCSEHCASIGLSLDAVVIMASNVGCVCRSTKPVAREAPVGEASTGGMAALLVAAQQQRQQQRPAGR